MPYRPTERTEARRAAAREAILAAALDQVAEGGYASAGMNAVVEKPIKPDKLLAAMNAVLTARGAAARAA